MRVVVPNGCGPGSVITVRAPDGRCFQVRIPAGQDSPGTVLTVAIPGAQPN